jgi:tripartite-type tricarboxylate transporter receptor subunit TctC
MKRSLIAACFIAVMSATAVAQPYPSRPITMVVPFGAGGPTDALARIVAQRMSVPLGQSVLVENVTGASGTIGITRVARAAPDGYTIVLGNWPSFVVASATLSNLSYDVFKDFEPIALLPNNPYVIVTKKDVPAKDLKELIAWLKANGDKCRPAPAVTAQASMSAGFISRSLPGRASSSCPIARAPRTSCATSSPVTST